MAIYRNISLSFWDDNKVIDCFTPQDRYFYLYLLTNPHTNLLGCYEISIKQMSNETGYSKKIIEKLIKRMEEVHKVIIYSEETREILLKNWYKYNWTRSNDLMKKVKSLAEYIKNENLVLEIGKIIEKQAKRIKEKEKIESIQTPSKDGGGTSVSVSVSDSVSVNNINNINFIKPTIAEIQKYCEERKNNIDAEKFFDYYESNGWQVGKTAMKNWKATIRTWEKTETKNSQQQNGVTYETV